MPPGRPLDSKKLDTMALVQDAGPWARSRSCFPRVMATALLCIAIVLCVIANRQCPGSPPQYLGVPALPGDVASAGVDNSNQGQFLYLVTGRTAPGVIWVALSQQHNVHVIFVSWQNNVGRAFNTTKLRLHFYPESTWTECRNFLYAKVDGLERELGFRMSYVMFADEDLVLNSRSSENPRFIVSSPVASALRLHVLLMRDQPARASVEYIRGLALLMQLSTDCVQSCAFDGVLDIFHRSIVHSFMPYCGKYNRKSWAMAQVLLNLRAQALMRHNCNLYREVFVDFTANAHASYPTDYTFMDNVTEFVSDCLLNKGFPLYRGAELSHEEIKLLAVFRPKPDAVVQQCLPPAKPGIDYSKEFAKDLKTWPRECC